MELEAIREELDERCWEAFYRAIREEFRYVITAFHISSSPPVRYARLRSAALRACRRLVEAVRRHFGLDPNKVESGEAEEIDSDAFLLIAAVGKLRKGDRALIVTVDGEAANRLRGALSQLRGRFHLLDSVSLVYQGV